MYGKDDSFSLYRVLSGLWSQCVYCTKSRPCGGLLVLVCASCAHTETENSQHMIYKRTPERMCERHGKGAYKSLN